jgi:hypothetical protein
MSQPVIAYAAPFCPTELTPPGGAHLGENQDTERKIYRIPPRCVVLFSGRITHAALSALRVFMPRFPIYTLGSLVNFFLIWILFKKDFLNNGTSHLSKTFVQSAVGAMIMGFVAYLALNVFDDIFGLTTTIGVFMQGFLSGIVGISVGVFALSMMKNQELADLTRALGRKFWKGRVIAPEQKEL